MILAGGLFGFLAWELKENWRLYARNRPRTLRPALVDGAAMRTALLAHHIRGYAVDEVILDPADPLDALLIAQGRVLQSAHSAWWRDEALANGAQMFATAIQAAADGAPIHVVPSAPVLARAAG